MTQPEFQDLLRRYLTGDCTTAERQQIEQWYEALAPAGPTGELSAAEREAVRARIWGRMQQLQAAPTGPGGPLRTDRKQPDQPLARPQRGQWWRRPATRWALAASLLLALGVGAWWPRQPGAPALPGLVLSLGADGWQTHFNPTGRTLRLRLEDGSTADLAPGARLRQPAHFAAARREVRLQGEAFFRVTKNPQRPFEVYTAQVLTRVLGTSFRVREGGAGQLTTVAVRTGKVAVLPCRPAPGRVPTAGVLLLPNQQAVYSVATAGLRKELVDKPVLLQPSRLSFENRPVAEVLDALGQAYGVPIAYDGAALRHCTVNISFDDETLFEQLGILCKTLDAHYELEGATVRFRSSGCGPQ